VAQVRTAVGAPALPGRARRRFRLLTPEVLAIAAGAAGWEVLGRALAFVWFPPLSAVLRAGVRLVQQGAIGVNLLASLSSLVVGFALSLLVGITVGVAMGRSPIVEVALSPYVGALLASPSLVFVPILFIFFGVGDATRVAVVFLYAVFIIIVNTATAVRTVSPPLIEMGRAFGATRRQLLWKVILPDALPLVMAGVRLGMGRAVKGMINGEMFIALVGLGAELRRYGGAFDAAAVLAILLVIMAVAATASWLVQLADRKLTWWAD